MRLLWISGRDISTDLARFTELGLASALETMGVRITMISPGINIDSPFNHIAIRKIRFPGLETLSASREIYRRLSSDSSLMGDADFLLVDWRFVKPLRRILKNSTTKWAIIDRGPPATSGTKGGRIRRELLRNLQKRYWNAAWRIASQFSVGGFVVSKEHGNLVNSVSGGGMRVYLLPAGTFPNRFMNLKTDPSIHLYLAYAGRVDKKRGLGNIDDLSTALSGFGLSHSISIIGEGDLSSEFASQSGGDSNIAYLGPLEHEETIRLLAKQHVGILPMPDVAIWRISSPIKLAEYVASGLAVIGPKHSGNILDGGGEWSLLSENADWTQDCASILARIIRDGNWQEEIVERALQDSENYHWDVIAGRMVRNIEEMLLQ